MELTFSEYLDRPVSKCVSRTELGRRDGLDPLQVGEDWRRLWLPCLNFLYSRHAPPGFHRCI